MISTKRPDWRRVLGVLGLMLGTRGVFAQATDSVNNSSVECISLARVVRAEVIDEQTIRFHMRGQEDYSNYLPSECPGLDDKSRFTYETTNNRLCNLDTITLLERGSRLTPGITCRLGKFVPASAERVVDLTLDESRGVGRNAIEVRRVDLEATDADETATPTPPPSDALETTDSSED